MTIALLVTFVFGSCVGSFVNVVALRLPSGVSWTRGRSQCQHCKRALRWYELVPVVSFLLQRGRCRRCSESFSIRYLVVEVVLGSLFAFVVYRGIGESGSLMMIASGWLLISVLLLAFLTDYTYHVLPVGLMIIGGAAVLVINAAIMHPLMSFIAWRIVAALVGGFWFGLQYFISHRQWVGEGDIVFGFVLGLMLGWPQILMVLWFAYVIGGVVAAMLLVTRRAQLGSRLPMGTFLALAAAIVYFWGERFMPLFKIM